MPEIVRVIRVLEYVGPREWVERTFAKNYVSPEGTKVGEGRFIREVARGDFIESFVVAPNSLGSVV